MSLYKQLWAAIIVLLTSLLFVSIVITTLSARDYLSEQLSLKNTDDANNLALFLEQKGTDADLLKLTVAAKFDTGYYELIELVNPEGETVIRRATDGVVANAPGWFVSLLTINAETGIANVQVGWEQIGTLTLRSQSRFAYEELWKGTFDPAGYSPPPTLSKSKENTGARILDMLRDKQSVGGATRQMNQLVSLGFQFNVLDKSIGKVSELDRSFSERMEIIRDVSNHKKFLDRKGLAIGGKTSEYLLFIDRRPGHQLAGNDVKFLGNGSRLITQESDLIDNHLDRFPDLCMYPESPEEFLSVYLDESNHTIQESVLNENYGKLKGYMEDNLETDVYFMVQDKRFEEGLWPRGIEERSWTMKRNDINSDIWKSSKNQNQDMAQILSENFGESTFQIVRTYSYNEDEQFNPHIHQFYLIQYRTNKNPIAHKIFSNTTDDVSFYPMPLSEFFNAGNVQDKRYKRYQFLNDCIRAMYVIINKEELSQIHEETIIEDILWYNMPFQLTRWLEFDKSPLSLLKEVREIDPQLAIFLKESICKSLWIDS